MNPTKRLMLSTLMVLTLSGVTAQSELSDPYEILNRHYEASGGLERLKAQKTSCLEASLVLVGTGLEGTLIQWSSSPIRSRQEVDLKVIKQVSGDNGEYAWTVDQNGKLQIRRDEETLKDRRLQILLAQYDHLDRNSEVFTLDFEGVDTAAGVDCYVVRMTNSVNKDVSTQYYDKATFMLVRTVVVTPEGENHTLYSDYRDVNGIRFAFKQESTQFPTGMTQMVTFTKVEMDVPIDESLFEPPSSDVEDFRFTNGRSAENIPFQFIENHIYLPVEIGGKTRLWILDSGASVTVIDEAFALELGLTPEGVIKGQGAGNLVDVSFTTLPAFSLPGLEFDEQRAASVKIGWLFDRWLGMEVVGILGYDFLSRLVTKVDYANETLSFYHPDSFSYQGEGNVLPSPISQGNMFELPVSIDGEHGGRWMLDLGAGGMSFHYLYAEAHGLFDLPGVDGLGHGAGGSSPRRRVLFDSIEFAGHTLQEPEVSIPRGRGEGGFGHSDLTGNIGNTLLRHFVLYLDYRREQVIVEKGADFDHVFPRDNSGLQLANVEGNRVEVIFVADNTPAAKAGFEVGDILTAVNEIEIEHLGGIVAITQLLRKAPGTKLSVEVSRSSEAKKLSLTLKDLFR